MRDSQQRSSERFSNVRGKLRRPTVEFLEPRWVRAGLPYGAMDADTGEYMLGTVAVTPVFLESNGQRDPNTENWTTAHKNEVLAKIVDGFDWWKQLLATKTNVHTLDFVIDRTYVDQPVPTVYEPINRPSDDYALWTQEFLMRVGFDQTNDLEANIRAFNNSQRLKAGTDWSFTMFVVNSQNEQDGTFAPGGSFTRAFAFAGGLFNVIPSTRPASTFAHETGHMFWARDEYAGSASYYAERGYYKTQNTNAIDANPNPNFQQAPSIMSSSTAMQTAWDNVVSPASTLAMLGWQDSDSDGIFDVLDVPLLLDGVGRVDVNSGNYRFVGKAKVQTLPNKNPSGLGNDITLNRISRIEARIAGAGWQVLAQPDTYDTTLNLSIPLGGATAGTIEIRAVDSATGITSNVFEGEISAVPDATNLVGINGFAWNDANANGLFDATESGLAAQTVQLVDSAGQPINLQRSIEPDARPPGSFASNAYAGVTITSIGADAGGSVGSFPDAAATTGTRVFRPYSFAQRNFVETWSDRRQLKIEFNNPVSFASVDVIGVTNGSYGRLELFNANGELIDRATSNSLGPGQRQNLSLGRDTADIAFIIVRGHLNTGIKIDNVQYGPRTQARTDSSGRYAFTSLPAGVYNVQIVGLTTNSLVTSAAGATQVTTLQDMQRVEHVDFGVYRQTTSWHNSTISADVNQSGMVTALDVLQIINLINQGGQTQLQGSSVPTDLKVDVSNDGLITALDALLVINYINSSRGSGEGEADACPQYSGGSPEATTPNSLVSEGEGEIAGPALPRVRTSASLSVEGEGSSSTASSFCDLEELAKMVADSQVTSSDQPSQTGSSNEHSSTDDTIAEAAARAAFDADLVARLQANPWTLPVPCHCVECMATDLANGR